MNPEDRDWLRQQSVYIATPTMWQVSSAFTWTCLAAVPDLLDLLAFTREHPVTSGSYVKKNPSAPHTLVCDFLTDEVGPLSAPEEVRRVGTGIMCVRRSALDKLRDSGTIRTYCEQGSTRQLREFFRFDVDSEGRLVSEDWFFCDRWRALSEQVWLYPVRSGHWSGGVPFAFVPATQTAAAAQAAAPTLSAGRAR
jgi:hypothetical protein